MIKRLIFILTIFICTSTYSQVHIENNTYYDLAEFSEIGIKMLGIDSIKLNISYISPINEGYYNGYVYKDSTGGYNIKLSIYPSRDFKDVFCHELIHVEQIYSGRLVTLSDTTVMYNYKIIDITKTPWAQREHEIDAMRGGVILRRAIEVIRWLK